MTAKPKGLEKRLFSTLPTRALFMADLTALDLRVLGLIALHDGMTLLKAAQGKPMGAGCTASNLTLTREAQCSYAALCRSISKLETHALIQKQDRRGGKGLTAIRVRYDTPDNVPTAPVQNDETVTLDPAQYDQRDIKNSPQYDQTAQMEQPRPAENRDDPADHYSSLREELDFAKAKELNSPKERTFKTDNFVGNLGKKLDAPKGKLGRVSIFEKLGANFGDVTSGGQVAIIERAFTEIERNPDSIAPRERQELSSLLWAIHETFHDEPFGQQALRLHEEIAPW